MIYLYIYTVKIFVFILSILIFTPFGNTHIDVIAYDDVSKHEHFHENELDYNHQQDHHEHDSENEKQSDHHHHCVDVSVSFAYIPSELNYDFMVIPNSNKVVDFYTREHSSKDLESLFQPPRFG